MSDTRSEIDEGQAKTAAKQTGRDPVLLAALTSVVLSLYLNYIRGNQQQAVFVGLWPPTFLAFASYFKQKDAADKLDRAV